MKKVEISKLPSISGAQTRKPVMIKNLESLKTSGIAFATYSMREGDVVEFPDTMDDVQVFSQPVRANSGDNGPVQALLVVTKNGKPNYLSLGSLRKQDVNREYTCKFTAELGEINNDYDRIEHLLGKKIKAVASKEIDVQAFDNLTGERLEGKTRKQVVPIIEYVS